MARRASPRAPPPRPWWLSSVPVLGVHLVRMVHHRCQDHADRLLFVPEHRTQPPLPASLSSSDWPPAESVHHGDTCNKRDDHANLFEPGCCGCCGCFQDGLSEEVCISTRSTPGQPGGSPSPTLKAYPSLLQLDCPLTPAMS